MPIVQDEWNYWYGPHVYGELGTSTSQGRSRIAAGLHEFFRNSDLFHMANYATDGQRDRGDQDQQNGRGPGYDGEVLALYRNRFGTIPVKVGGAPEPLDVAAAWTEGKKALTIAIVNPTKTAQNLPLSVKGARLSSKAKLWVITGVDPQSKNVPGKDPEVKTVEKKGVSFGSTLTVPPMSVSLYEIATR